MDVKKLEQEIRKTGFVLENDIAQILKEAEWTVISNKYYIDDQADTVREIDLVAYRVSKVQQFSVYTVLIISCKKSESNVWALLARDINLNDPNSDWYPLHTWTNDKALLFKLSENGVSKQYYKKVRKLGVTKVLAQPEVEVFAFQEMDKNNGKPQNDKPIFSAVTSLIKAQAYELGILPLRKKDTSIYQFNLISVVDAELARLMFNGKKIECTEIDTEHYLANYIVKKKESFSRIHFIRSNAFEHTLKDYDRLHQANKEVFSQYCDNFYDGILKDYLRYSVLLDEFKKKVGWQPSSRIRNELKINAEIGSYCFSWNDKESHVKVEVTLKDSVIDDSVVDFLNQDLESKKCVKQALKSIFRYEGEFIFEGIPF
jgi:hypothetical protein